MATTSPRRRASGRGPRLMTGGRRCVVRDRFTGEILGVGTGEGTRVVVGSWAVSPYGRFADVMVERPDGHRVLLAPSDAVADYIADTYSFDEIRVVPVVVEHDAGGLSVSAGPLVLSVRLGARTVIGRMLRILPEAVTTQVWFSRVSDPVARILLPGVRTRGTAGGGRREFYGAHDVRTVTALRATWNGDSLGDLAPVEPPPRFGFGSTPHRPSLTRLTTTVIHDHKAEAPVEGFETT